MAKVTSVYAPTTSVFEAEGIAPEAAENTSAMLAAEAPQVPTASGVGGSKVNVVSPFDGKTYGLDSGFLGDAVAKGYRVETPEERDIRQYVDANKGLSGSLRVGLTRFAQEASFGIGEAVFNHALDAKQRATWEALKADHGWANAVGSAAGFGASLLGGGELFQGAAKAGRLAEGAVLGEKALASQVATRLLEQGAVKTTAEAAQVAPGLARTILANAAKGGTESLALTAPKALTELALGDPEHAGETLAWSLGAGVLMGGAAGLAGGAFRGLAKGAAKGLGEGAVSEKIRSWADGQAVNALNPAQKFAKQIERIQDGGTEVGAWLRKEGLIIKPGESIEDFAKRAQGYWEAKGQAIGAEYAAITKQAGEAGKLDVHEAVDSVYKKALAQYETGTRAVGMEGVLADGKKLLESVSKKAAGADGKLTIEEARQLRTQIDSLINWRDTAATAKNEMLVDVRNALNDHIFDKMSAAGEILGDPGVVGRIRALNKDYQIASVVRDASEHNVVRGMSNRKHSLTDYLGDQIGATIGGFIGGGPGALIGGFAGGQINNYLRHYGPSAAVGIADALAGKGAGLLVSEQALKRASERIDSIPARLAGVAVGGRAGLSAARETMGPNLLSRLIGADYADDVQHGDGGGIMGVARRLKEIAETPGKLDQHASEAFDFLGDEAPQTRAAAEASLKRAIDYLARVAPSSTPAVPLAPKNTGLKAPAAQQEDFQKRLNVVLNPLSVIDQIGTKALSPAEVDALKTVYPKLYESVRTKIVAYAADPESKPLPSAYRMQLDTLLGAPLGAPKNVAAYQAVYTQPPANPKSGGRPMKVPQLGTDLQRVTMGG